MTEQLSPQNNENNEGSSADIFQPYIDELSKEKKAIIIYLDSLNFTDYHEKVLDLEGYYLPVIENIHDLEKDYLSSIREIKNDKTLNDTEKTKKIENYGIEFKNELEIEKQKFIKKCNEIKESIQINQSRYN